MKKRQWNANTNTRMVIEGLQGEPVAELCHAYQISQSEYDQWPTKSWRTLRGLLKSIL